MTALTPSLLLRYLGIPYNERSGRLSLRCPWHDDQTPSASIYLDTELFHCFTCDLTLGLVNFYSKFTRQSQARAMEELSKSFVLGGNETPEDKGKIVSLLRKQLRQHLTKVEDTVSKVSIYQSCEALFWDFLSGKIEVNQLVEKVRACKSGS